jgi:hypothetical protein
MKTVRIAFLISLGLSLACLVIAYLDTGAWIPIIIGLAAGVQWGWLGWKGRPTYSYTFLILFGLQAYAAAIQLPAIWLLGGVVFLLAAGDLGEFAALLSSFAAEEDRQSLVRAHLRRLGGVCGAGLGLGLLATAVKIRLGFEAALLLGLLVFLGLAGAVRYLTEKPRPE